MNATDRILTNLVALVAVLTATLAGTTLHAQAPSSGAEVRGVLGRAKYSSAGGAYALLKGGMMLHAGDVIQTASGSAVDLYFGPGAGTLRLPESTTVAIEKLTATASGFDIELTLREGELLGKGIAVPAGSKLVFRNAAGFAAVLSGHFRLSAKGYVVLLEGRVVFVQIPPSGEPLSQIINAPPAVYWSPAEGIKPAPSALVREVNNQTRSKLPKG